MLPRMTALVCFTRRRRQSSWLFLLAMLAIPLHGVAAPEHSSEAAWLLGVWELQFNPDGTTKDWIEFRADGTFVSTTAACRTIEGLYRVEPEHVRMTLRGADFSAGSELQVSEDRRVLSYRSLRTGNASTYRRAAATSCGSMRSFAGCGPRYPEYFPCLPGAVPLPSPKDPDLPGMRQADRLRYPVSAADLSRTFARVAVESGWTPVSAHEGHAAEGPRYRASFTRPGRSVFVSIFTEGQGATLQVMEYTGP